MVPRNIAHGHTPDKHRNPAHDNRTHQSQHRLSSSMRREDGTTYYG